MLYSGSSCKGAYVMDLSLRSKCSRFGSLATIQADLPRCILKLHAFPKKSLKTAELSLSSLTAQLLADSFRASNIQSWSCYHYYPQRTLPTKKNKRKVWKAGSTSSKPYFWGQDHVFFHSFQHILHAAYKQLNNHQLVTSNLFNTFANVTLPHGHFPASWLTFSAFAAAMASFKTSTLPDSMAFLSALAACTGHSSQYCIQHSQLARHASFLPTGRKSDEEMYENLRFAQPLHFGPKTGNYQGRTTKPKRCAPHSKKNMCMCTQRRFAKTTNKVTGPGTTPRFFSILKSSFLWNL